MLLSSKANTALQAPLDLKTPAFCMFSHLKNNWQSKSFEMLLDVKTGVR
jgi:hypothetical protein